MNEYADIFSHRGHAYHQAMLMCPDARRVEFEIPIQWLELEPDSTVYDFPSGGGYLKRFLPKELESVNLHSLEVSADFSEGNVDDYQLANWENLPIPDASADGLVSLAALHHVSQRSLFYAEVYRALRQGGKFVIGDVEQGSVQDAFLNIFVNNHNSMGHRGDFLEPKIEEMRIASAGFEIVRSELCHYLWEFEDQVRMLHFCRGLFGLDQADDAQILDGLEPMLRGDSTIEWALRFIKAVK